MLSSRNQPGRKQAASALDQIADIQILSLAFAHNLTAPALQATVKAIGQGIVEVEHTGKQVLDYLHTSVG
jgi:hypothetical protein